MATETDEKVRENRLRRRASRQGLSLRKSRARDPHAVTYGGFMLVRTSDNVATAGSHPEYSMTLDDVESYLDEAHSSATQLRRQQVETAPNTYKRLGECTADDLAASIELGERRAERLHAGVDALRAGRAPQCDHLNDDGSFCDETAVAVVESDNLAEYGWFCSAHLPGA